MTRGIDHPESGDLAAAEQQGATSTDSPRVLVVDADPALLELLDEWLAAEGCRVVAGAADSPAEAGPFDIVLVDVPFPRQGGPSSLRGVMSAHPGTPIVALSSTFFAGVDSTGAVARRLGVSSVLPKPVDRDALLGAVRRLAGSPR